MREQCPECEGQKGGTAIACPGARVIWVPCGLCAGDGCATPTRLDWWRRGKRCRQRRIAEEVTLRKAAQLMGISATEYSDRERGRADPEPLERFLDGIDHGH